MGCIMTIMNRERVLRVCGVWAMSATIMISSLVEAQRLPTMNDGDWWGYFSGYQRRNFEFGINNVGEMQIYLMNKRHKKRVGMTRTIKIDAEVLVVSESGNSSIKGLKNEEGFSTEMKPGLDHKEVKFTAKSIGDAKVEITMQYDGDRIIMDGRILDRGTLKEGKIYFVYKVSVPAMYGRTYDDADDKKLKSVMRRDKFKFTRADDRKRVSLKTYEEVDLGDDDKAKGGVTDIAVDMSSQEGNVFTFTTLDGSGVIELENKSTAKKAPLWKGYTVKWKREFTEKETHSDTKGRTKMKRGISPFVIRIK